MSAEGYDRASELPTHTDMSTTDDFAPAPTTNGTGEPTLKDAFVNNAASAVNTVTEHPITQNIVNGPVATSVKDQAASTKSEFSDLASSRQPPSYTAANDTTLTHYHSFFYTLLSWKNKRATGITFACVIAFIFACRYLPIIRYVIKITWMTLGGVDGSSVASSLRPQRYYKIPKETLEASLDDLENLINFFVIEIQRLVFAENVPVTAAAFLTAFLTYYLIKIVPFWGMALITSCVVFLGPLTYIQNKEFIDSQLEHAGNIIGQQTAQIRDLTAQHTSKGLDTMKQYTGTYATKAQEMVGSARQRIPSPTTGKAPVKEGDFPSAPKTDLTDTSGDTLYRQTEPISS
ncbi:hypothetical protein AYL99_09716 [Fonsecaea erecta]|uniref:Reticulon-like protein n=1 Tax=Fonsecaea erecta TaxID=1367422 RepID=A0A178Z9T2_9EURO|nr:hypothetical protein AYL99_09716 [Fonsecaea erecta]OAP56537.1 hypothetical protein AYL99_09716 [Fonsecaea erecta]